MEEVYSNDAGTLRIEASATGPYLQLVWNSGPRPDKLVEAMFDHVLTSMLDHQIWRVLVDQTTMESASVAAQLWFRQVWLPRAAMQLTRGCAAIAVGQSIFTYMETISVMRDSQQSIPNVPYLGYRLFPTVEKAQAWLEEQQ